MQSVQPATTSAVQTSGLHRAPLVTVADLERELEHCFRRRALVLLKAGASWCGPCKHVQPTVDERLMAWSARLPLALLHFDVDQATELATELKIRSMPSFVLLTPGPCSTLREDQLRHVGGDRAAFVAWIDFVLGACERERPQSG